MEEIDLDLDDFDELAGEDIDVALPPLPRGKSLRQAPDSYSIFHLGRTDDGPDPEYESLLKLRKSLPNPGSKELDKQFGIKPPKASSVIQPDILKLGTKLPFEKSRKAILSLKTDLASFDTSIPSERGILLDGEYNCYYKFPKYSSHLKNI